MILNKQFNQYSVNNDDPADIIRLFRVLADRNIFPVLLLDSHGFIRLTNDKFNTEFADRFSEAEGLHYLVFFDESKHEFLEEKRAELLAGNESTFDVPIIDGSGNETIAEINSVLCYSIEKKQYFCLVSLNMSPNTADTESKSFIPDIADNLTSSALLKATRDSVYIVDIEGRILKTNKIGMQRLQWIIRERGGTVENIAGMTLPDFFPDKEASFIRKYLNRVILSNELDQSQREWRGKFFDLSIYPVRDTRGEVRTAVIFVSNITNERKTKSRLEASDQRYRALVESMNDGLVIIDRNARFVYMNTRLCELSGYDLDDIMGKSAYSFITEESRSSAAEIFEKSAKIEHQRFETECIASNGGVYHALVSLRSFYDSNNDLSGIVGVVTDISGMKETASRLKYIAAFEGLIARISAGFLKAGVKGEDSTITSSLEAVARFENFDSALICQFVSGNIRCTHFWEKKSGESSGEDCMPEVEFTDLKYAAKKLLKQEIFQVNSFEELPDDAESERELFKKAGIKSCILLPMLYGDEVAGVIGFFSASERSLSPETLSLLRIISDVFVNVIEKNKIEKELFSIMISRLSSREIELLRYFAEGKKWPGDKREIAKNMDVLPGTLDKFMARIKEKLGINHTEKIVSAARFYLKHLE